MNIYLVERVVGPVDYDEYDSFVCVAACESDAREMSPRTGWAWPVKDTSTLKVSYIGHAGLGRIEPDIILASFNAG